MTGRLAVECNTCGRMATTAFFDGDIGYWRIELASQGWIHRAPDTDTCPVCGP